MQKIKSRYEALTTALLLSAAVMSLIGAVRYVFGFFSLLGQYIDASYQPYSDSGLVPYLDTMSGYYGRPDISEVIEQLVFMLGLGIFAAGLIIVLKRGTDNRTLPTIFCMGGLALTAVSFLGGFLQLLFMSEYAFFMLIQGALAALAIAVMVFFPRVTKKRKNVIALAVSFTALILFIPVVMPNYVFFYDKMGIAVITMLGIMGVAEAVKEDGNEEEEPEEDEAEDNV